MLSNLKTVSHKQLGFIATERETFKYKEPIRDLIHSQINHSELLFLDLDIRIHKENLKRINRRQYIADRCRVFLLSNGKRNANLFKFYEEALTHINSHKKYTYQRKRYHISDDLNFDFNQKPRKIRLQEKRKGIEEDIYRSEMVKQAFKLNKFVDCFEYTRLKFRNF